MELTLHATQQRLSCSTMLPCLRLQHLGAAARVDCQSSEDVCARHLHSTADSSIGHTAESVVSGKIRCFAWAAAVGEQGHGQLGCSAIRNGSVQARR